MIIICQQNEFRSYKQFPFNLKFKDLKPFFNEVSKSSFKAKSSQIPKNNVNQNLVKYFIALRKHGFVINHP